MKQKIMLLLLAGWLAATLAVWGQAASPAPKAAAPADTSAAATAGSDSLPLADEADTDLLAGLEDEEPAGSFHQVLKEKFIEGNAGFMSLVAMALIVGLGFCIERIVYLSLSEINAKKLLGEVDARLAADDVEGAKALCRDTRGPVASICYQGLLRIHERLDSIERSIASYGSVQAANLNRGCSWITLCITIAPSLGFLGTVIGMVMAFDDIRMAGDINASIVAAGMKVALITTIFGIIVALILQLFYNFILSKIDHLTSQMEESAITLLDSLTNYKERHNG